MVRVDTNDEGEVRPWRTEAFRSRCIQAKDVPWREVESADINTTEFRPSEEDIVTDLISGNGYSEENASALKKEVLTSS